MPDMREIYYSELFNLFFPEDKSPKGLNREEAFKTFVDGGYYRYDFPDRNLTLLSMNTLIFNSENVCELENATKQLNWLEQQL